MSWQLQRSRPRDSASPESARDSHRFPIGPGMRRGSRIYTARALLADFSPQAPSMHTAAGCRERFPQAFASVEHAPLHLWPPALVTERVVCKSSRAKRVRSGAGGGFSILSRKVCPRAGRIAERSQRLLGHDQHHCYPVHFMTAFPILLNQCDRSTQVGGCRRMLLVAPPRMNSLIRE